MPIYEYYCGKCKAVHEVTQRISAPPLAACPVCRSKGVRKLISRSSFQLKGAGWYVTDYGRNGAGASAGNGNGNGATPKKETESAEPSAPAKETKSESAEKKPETKPTPAPEKPSSAE